MKIRKYLHASDTDRSIVVISKIHFKGLNESILICPIYSPFQKIQVEKFFTKSLNLP